MLALWLVLLIFTTGLPGAAQAASPLDEWREEAKQTRILAENDMPRAHAEAQRLQRSLPADAPLADQARALNLLARIELYLALTEPAAQHARQAMELARQSGDRAEQAEADLVVAVNAINQGRIGVAAAATDRALSILDGVDRPDLLAEAMLRTAMMYRRKGKFDESVTTAMQQMEIAKRVNTPLVMTYAYQGLGMSFDHSSRPKEASEHFRRMLEQARKIPSRRLVADALLGLGGVQHQQGEVRAAEASFHQAIAIYRPAGCPFCLARGLFTLGDFLMHQRRHAEALPLFGEAAALQERHANRIGLWWVLKTRSETWQALGRLDAAQADAERSHALVKEVGVALYLGESAKRLAAIAAARGDHGQAYRFAREAMEIAERADRERASARILELTERYETESKQREIDELTRRNEQQAAELRQRELQQRWLWTVLGGGAIAFAGTVYFLLRLRRSKRMLEALNARMQQAQNKLQATMDAIPDLLFVLDIDGRCHDFHSPRTDLLAAPAQDLIGRTVAEVLPTEAAAACMSALREARDKGFSTGRQFQLALPQGQRWFELSVARKSVVPGEKLRFVVLSRDITERKAYIRDLQRWQDIFEHAEWGVVVGSVDGRTLELMNPAFARMHGYTVEELTGQSLLEVFAPDHRESVPEHIRLAHQKGHHAFESWHLRKDGTIFPVFIDVTTVLGPNGEVTYRIVNVQDITERKEAERRLHEQEQAIRAVVENSPDAITRFDRQCRRVYANPVTQKLFGLPPEQILGRTLQEGSPLPTSFADMLQGVFTSGRPSQVELPFLWADGEMGWCDVRLVPEFGPDGQITSVLSIGTDISARKVAEDALRESEEKFRTLIQKIQAAVVVHGADTRILTSNVVAQQILGLSEAQLDGKAAIDPAWHFFREDGSPMPLEEYPVNQVLASRQPLRDLVLGVHRPGLENDVWALVNADPVLDKNEEVAQVIVTFIDITQRKRAEEALADREREFRTLAENSPDIIMRYDNDGQRTYVNPAYVRETHVPLTDALHVTPRAQWQASITPSVEEYLGVLRQVMASGEPADLTVSWKRAADGSSVFHALRIVAERDAGGRVVGTLAIGRNITAQKLVEQELKEREQRYRGIFDNVLDTLYLLEVTPEGRFRNLEVNPAFEKSSGMSSAELIGKFIEETVPQEVAEIVTAKYRRCIEAGAAIDEEVALDLPSGRRHYHSTLVPVRDADGRIHRIVGISRDITERKRMEEELAAREREFRTLAENSPDPIYRYDRDCRRLYVNPVVGRILGKPVDALIGTSPADGAVLVSEQNRRVMQAIRQVFDSGEPAHCDLDFVAQDGQHRDYQMLLVPERDAGGQVATVLALARDVTAIRDAERRMSRFLANVPGFVYSFRMSPDGHFSFPFASPGIQGIYGLQPEDVRDDMAPLHALTHPDDRPVVESALAEAARTLAPFQIEVRVLRPGWPERWVECRSAPERETDGGTLWHGLMLDITERKRMERHLEESQHLLRELAARNETAREDERKYLKREIHDELGQYLLALRLGISIVDIQLGEINAPLQKKTQRLIEMVDSTIKVVRNVVASLRPAALDMGIVSALEWLAGEYSERTGIQCELHVTEEEILLNDTCATAIFRIVQESLTNIVRHAQASKVEITLERNEADYLLEVRDNGRGFDPGIRKEKSFGLVGIRERALMLGGRIDIASGPGRGTSIRAHIPIHNVVTNALSES